MANLFSATFLFIAQAFSAVLMTTLVLMQVKGTGLSGAFGGDNTFYRSKRGVEKIVFNLTIISASVFLLSSFLTLYQ